MPGRPPTPASSTWLSQYPGPAEGRRPAPPALCPCSALSHALPPFHRGGSSSPAGQSISLHGGEDIQDPIPGIPASCTPQSHRPRRFVGPTTASPAVPSRLPQTQLGGHLLKDVPSDSSPALSPCSSILSPLGNHICAICSLGYHFQSTRCTYGMSGLSKPAPLPTAGDHGVKLDVGLKCSSRVSR